MPKHTGKAILFEGAGNPLVEKDLPLPDELEPGAILVKMKMATVCGSDMHTFQGRRPFPTPAILGHEGVGTIEKLGEGIGHDTSGRPITTGDRITWSMISGCRDCYFCRIKGLPQKCINLHKYGHVRSDVPPYFTGTFAEYIYLKPGTGLFKIPEELTDAEACPLMCAGATVTGGFEKIGIEFGDNVMIQGAGMLGVYASAIARERGVKQVIVTDFIDKRLDLVKQFGADQVLNVKGLSAEDLSEKIGGLTDGRGADLILEVTGNPKALESGIKCLAIWGRYLLQGSLYPGDNFTLDGNDVILRCATIVGKHNYESRHLMQVMEFAAKNRDKYPFRKLAGPEFPLTAKGVTDAIEALDRREAVRPIVLPE